MADSKQQFKAGEARGQAQATTDQWIESAKSTANTACKETSNATQSAKESAQHGKDEASGFLQQTGEQVKNMAQGAVDSLKSTLGVGDQSSKN